MRRYFNTHPNRTLCDVLADMRKCHETHNYSLIPSLIEEAQIMGNRMESGLYDKNDVDEMSRVKKELKEEIKKLQETVDEAKECKTEG